MMSLCYELIPFFEMKGEYIPLFRYPTLHFNTAFTFTKKNTAFVGIVFLSLQL